MKWFASQIRADVGSIRSVTGVGYTGTVPYYRAASTWRLGIQYLRVTPVHPANVSRGDQSPGQRLPTMSPKLVLDLL